MIYLDFAATTPCAPEVIEAMKPYWSEKFGNPSSSHYTGRLAKQAVSKAREQVAELINCNPAEIFFTSGATESNNILFLAILLDLKEKRRKIAVSVIEHKAVLAPAKFLAERGFELIQLPVAKGGVVDVFKAEKLIDSNTALVSVQTANNEIGTIQPVKEIAEISHIVACSFHTDAVQSLGKIPFDVKDIDCDFASFSAHKMYGPKGIGALYVKGGVRSWTWALPLHGGGQEKGIRPGTHNVPGIVGFGEACRLAKEDLQNRQEALQSLTDEACRLIKSTLPHSIIHVTDVERIPGIISFSVIGLPADVIAKACSDICFSTGAACSEGTLGHSHILKHICDDEHTLDYNIRISLGVSSKIEQISRLIICIKGLMRV